jgi:hypothetical protein
MAMAIATAIMAMAIMSSTMVRPLFVFIIRDIKQSFMMPEHAAIFMPQLCIRACSREILQKHVENSSVRKTASGLKDANAHPARAIKLFKGY